MKKFEYRISNYSLLYYTIIMLLIWLGCSLYYHDFDRFEPVFIWGIAPNVFIFFFGEKKIKEENCDEDSVDWGE